MPKCSSGKLMFGNERSANRAVQRARERGEIGPLRHYLCPRCKHWHLARKETARLSSGPPTVQPSTSASADCRKFTQDSAPTEATPILPPASSDKEPK